MENKEFIMSILNDEYMLWLSKFIEKYNKFDDCYFFHYGKEILSERDKIFIYNLEIFVY